MRERGAERQRGPGQLRIVVQLRFERNKLHTPGYVSQTLFPFLCSQTITLRVSRPFLQLSPATAAIVMFGMSIWNLSSLSFPSFSFYSKTQPPEQNNCRRESSISPFPLFPPLFSQTKPKRHNGKTPAGRHFSASEHTTRDGPALMT